MEQSTKYFLFFITKYVSQCVCNNQLELDRTINQIILAFMSQSMPPNVYAAINWNSMEQSTKYFSLFSSQSMPPNV